ncbi:MAG: acetate--CoA ligase family protein [Candidatus Aminicenantes bacterium]|nr:acetate--CoA ligase family protein [Candidatus Aminicenantes bacterium]
MNMKKNNIKESMTYLFEPRSVAVIGASHREGKIGHTICRNILTGGYTGELYPVNPKGGSILGRKVYGDILAVPDQVDLATITVPAKYVLESVKQCAGKGVKHIQVITSGFSEIGNTEEENKIVAAAKEKGMRVLGPNIFGIYSAAASMNATFSASTIQAGHVAILTQSGALGVAMIGKTTVDNIGLSAIVSTGNKCDIDETDLLAYLVPQEQTKVILMYIEGVKDGARLIETLKWATAQKPIVVIKSGRSKRGAMAAASHTGSLAGSDEIFDAIMRQCGVIRAETIEEAFNWSKFLAFSPTPGGKNTVIVTNGGGVGVLATDACEKFNIHLYDDQKVLKEVFDPSTPSYGSTKNPVDITGGAGSDHYIQALSAPLNCDTIDAAISLYCETSTFDSDNLVPMIRDTYKEYKKVGKPISYAIVGGEYIEKAIVTLRKENIPVSGDVYDAVSALGILYRYRHYLDERSDVVDEADLDIGKIERIVDQALRDNRTFLLSDEGLEVMKAADIGIPRSRIARSLEQVLFHAEEIGYPLVMKVVSRDILHKSDAGGVALDLQSKQEVIDAYEAIIRKCKAYKPGAVIDGIEVSEMLESGTELIVGARRDPSFGPIVMCGLGGIYVEVMKDVVFRGLPLNKKEVLTMLKEIKSFPILLGVRGEARRDIEGVIDTIIKVGTILKHCKKITDIEINPIVVYEQARGLRALDARILIRNPKEGK